MPGLLGDILLMIRLINVPGYTIIVSVLVIFILFSPMAVAKHIIVVYDVSGSMVSLKMGGNTNIYMESEDIRRVNEYLTDLLFTNTAQSLRDMDDSYIKECDAAYVGKPLYQSGDILTYAEYAKQRVRKINRTQIRKNEFQRQLPNSTALRESFYGMVSYLLRAEVEVYDALYNDADDETYWVFVTDGDIDNSGKSDPGISTVLKRHAEIEDEFYSPMIFSVLVNKHVRIQVRKLQRSEVIDSVILTTPTKPGKPVQEIQLDRDDKGKFISETLIVETHNSDESKFKLNSVNVEIVDKFNKPLQIVSEDDRFNVIEVPSVLLHGNSPPYEFRIPFPVHREIAAPGNALKLEVTYSFNGEDKIHSPKQPIKYTTRIDSIYVSDLDNLEQQAEKLNLNFSEDAYRVDLIIQSESPNKKAFKIEQLQCYIEYKDGRKLCDATVPKDIEHLGETFYAEVPKLDRLDWHGNKVVLEIDYKYNKEAKSETIKIPYKLDSKFPMWILWVFLIPVLGISFFLLLRAIVRGLKPELVEHRIKLTIENAVDGLISNDVGRYTLTDKDSLTFGENDEHEHKFDVGWSDCPDFLRCEPNSSLSWLPWSKKKGGIRHYKSIDDTEGEIVDPPKTLILKRGENNIEVRVEPDVENSTSDPKSDDKSFKGTVEDVDPLKV